MQGRVQFKIRYYKIEIEKYKEHGKELIISARRPCIKNHLCHLFKSQPPECAGSEERKKKCLQTNIKATITNLQTKFAKVTAAKETAAKKKNTGTSEGNVFTDTCQYRYSIVYQPPPQ